MVYVRWQTIRDDPRFGRVYQHVSTRPSWVWRTTIGLVVAIFSLPFALLLLAALIFALLLYTLLNLINQAMEGLASIFGGFSAGTASPNSGRRNVRVVERDEG